MQNIDKYTRATKTRVCVRSVALSPVKELNIKKNVSGRSVALSPIRVLSSNVNYSIGFDTGSTKRTTNSNCINCDKNKVIKNIESDSETSVIHKANSSKVVEPESVSKVMPKKRSPEKNMSSRINQSNMQRFDTDTNVVESTIENNEVISSARNVLADSTSGNGIESLPSSNMNVLTALNAADNSISSNFCISIEKIFEEVKLFRMLSPISSGSELNESEERDCVKRSPRKKMTKLEKMRKACISKSKIKPIILPSQKLLKQHQKLKLNINEKKETLNMDDVYKKAAQVAAAQREEDREKSRRKRIPRTVLKTRTSALDHIVNDSETVHITRKLRSSYSENSLTNNDSSQLASHENSTLGNKRKLSFPGTSDCKILRVLLTPISIVNNKFNVNSKINEPNCSKRSHSPNGIQADVSTHGNEINKNIKNNKNSDLAPVSSPNKGDQVNIFHKPQNIQNSNEIIKNNIGGSAANDCLMKENLKSMAMDDVKTSNAPILNKLSENSPNKENEVIHDHNDNGRVVQYSDLGMFDENSNRTVPTKNDKNNTVPDANKNCENGVFIQMLKKHGRNVIKRQSKNEKIGNTHYLVLSFLVIVCNE